MVEYGGTMDLWTFLRNGRNGRGSCWCLTHLDARLLYEGQAHYNSLAPRSDVPSEAAKPHFGKPSDFSDAAMAPRRSAADPPATPRGDGGLIGP